MNISLPIKDDNFACECCLKKISTVHKTFMFFIDKTDANLPDFESYGRINGVVHNDLPNEVQIQINNT